MISRRQFTLGLAAAALVPDRAWAALSESPFLRNQVASGALPPIRERIPRDPALAEVETIGQPGGELRMLMSSPKDTRLMVVYGYARLVSSTPALALTPDILKAVDNEEGRSFTLHLRGGHKWSDGEPFTAEDFRYWFEDMANNPELSTTGLPLALLPNGEQPQFQIIDAETVRYSWTRPNPLFLPAMAGAYPLYIYAPAHYLKQFHPKYADKDKLAALVKNASARNWASLHTKLDNEYRNDNPNLPSLQPWVLRTKPPADRIVFERNPYYYRLDGAGHQLPYIDRVVMSIADSKIIPAKTGAGESDLQARYLRFDDYTFLKAGEAENGYRVRLWRTGPCSQLAIYPNLNVSDPAWRQLMQNVDFRRALSLGIDRHEINQVIYFGLAIEGQNTVLPQSPLYRPEYREAWAKFDPDQANKLLDGLGLGKRDSDGMRLLPDGRALDLIVENSGESSEKSDTLELIRDSWRKIGVRLFSKPEQLTLFRKRVFSGSAQVSLDNGIDNGLPTADRSPADFAPTSQQQLQWPRWGQFVETKGQAGETPDLPAAVQLKKLYGQWLDATSEAEHARIWHEMLKIYADNVFSIGLVAGVLQPIVVNKRLRNVPEHGVYAWDPGAQFGIYKPDGFWFDTEGSASASLEPERR